MICGNRKAGKGIVAVAIAALLVLIFITAVVAFHKRTAPVKEPPLVPQENNLVDHWIYMRADRMFLEGAGRKDPMGKRHSPVRP
jgi:hypothetical protein